MTDRVYTAEDLLAAKEQSRQGEAIATMQRDLADIKRSVHELTTFVNETKGGKKWLWAIISAAATLGTLVGSALKWKFGG